jgi:hypothetical protein
VDRTILPATAGEDASGAAGAVVVKVRQRKPEHNPERRPEHNPRVDRHNPIRLRCRLRKHSQFIKGSQQ